MKWRQVLWNAVTTFAQVFANAAVLFLLYRFLIRALGIERLGIWSLVLATTSIITLANQGLSTSIVKFVAKYAARGNSEEVSSLLQTAVISAATGLALLSVGLYPLARHALVLVLPAGRVAEAVGVLPFALVSLWLNVIGMIAQAGLAGHEEIAACNYIDFGGLLSYLALAILLVPRHGLIGLAVAQVVQGAIGLMFTWQLLWRRVGVLPWVPHCWRRAQFEEMAGYGAEFQFITLCQAAREPTTKALLAKFGGLALTGYYDMASRFVVTIRELIVQANQVLVPTISHMSEREPEAIPRIYRESYRLIFFFGVPSFALLVIASPLVSVLWIGRYESIFVDFVVLLAAGWLVNVLSNPAYVVDLATGALRAVTLGCSVTAALNLLLGLAFGHYIGGTAIVAASAFSLALGCVIVLVAYHIANGQQFNILVPRESFVILALSIVGVFILTPLLCSFVAGASFSPLGITAAVGTLVTIIAFTMWSHPIRRRLSHWVASGMPS